jgi:hypothetical protein
MKAILKYTNTLGESVTFDNTGSFFYANKIKGLGDVGADIQTQKAPYQDGVSFLDSILAPRAISFELVILGDNAAIISQRRSELARILNPKLGEGVLEITYGSIVRVIDALSEHVPFYPSGRDSRGEVYQIGLVDLLCPNPYWRSSEESVEQLVTFSGGLTFPLTLPTIFGNQDSTAKSRIIVNEGDSPTPIEVTFTGPAISPIRIENETTGEFIEVAQSLLDGEKLWISTQFGKKRVEKIAVDGTVTNAFNYIKINPIPSLSSTFFQLQEGNNLITYSIGEEYEKAPVTISYYNRYLAI